MKRMTLERAWYFQVAGGFAVDLYFLRKLVRPSGLLVLDDVTWPSVATALSYFDRHLGWQPVEMPGRSTARRLPAQAFEPDFTDFRPF